MRPLSPMQIALAVLGGLLLGLVVALAAAQLLSRRTARQLADSEARLRANVQEFASAALRDNADVFLKLAREAFGREQASIQGTWREREQAFQALVEPIRSALEKTEAQVLSLERERREAFGSLRSQIETLAQGQSALQRETRNLVTALRRPEVRGRWGELTLRRVVELAGLSEHCDFTEQPSVGDDTRMLRPDLVVHMPEGRKLVIDATNRMGEPVANSRAALPERVRYARAFNTVGGENMADPMFESGPADMFFSAPEDDRSTVATVIEGVGMRPVYVGADQEALLDGLFRRWVALAVGQGRGRRLAFRLLEG